MKILLSGENLIYAAKGSSTKEVLEIAAEDLAL